MEEPGGTWKPTLETVDPMQFRAYWQVRAEWAEVENERLRMLCELVLDRFDLCIDDHLGHNVQHEWQMLNDRDREALESNSVTATRGSPSEGEA